MTRVMLSLVFVGMLGCTSLGDLRDSDGGTTEVYEGKTKADLLKASEGVLRKDGGAQAVERDEGKDALYAVFPGNGMVYESYGAVWVKELDGNLEVRCLTKRSYALGAGIGLTESTFHHRLKQALGLIPQDPPSAIDQHRSEAKR